MEINGTREHAVRIRSGSAGGIKYVEVTIYIDVLWLRTFFVELSVCIFVNFWMKQARPVARILWMSALAVSLEILLFVAAGYGAAFSAGSLLLRVSLIKVLFRPESGGIFLRLFLWSLAATIAFGGMLGFCLEHLPDRYWFAAGSMLCALGVMASLLLEERRRRHDGSLHRVTLRYGARTVEVIGLHDTGNRLSDPYVHAPVYILARSEAGRLGLESGRGRLIPFSSVGAPDGLMEVWTIDAMEWTDKRLEPVVVGAAEDALFAEKDYRLILSAGWSE